MPHLNSNYYTIFVFFITLILSYNNIIHILADESLDISRCCTSMNCLKHVDVPNIRLEFRDNLKFV